MYNILYSEYMYMYMYMYSTNRPGKSMKPASS